MARFAISVAVGLSVMLCIQATSSTLTHSDWDMLVGVAAAILTSMQMERMESK